MTFPHLVPIPPLPDITPTWYLPLGGTGHAQDAWVTQDDDLFTLSMRARNFQPIRPNGKPWAWSGEISGLWVFTGGDAGWHRESDKLGKILDPIPFEHRNLFAHSDAGQLVIILAAKGFPIRTLTTFGTPNRQNLPSAEAVKHIRYWQHLYDKDRDWMASLKRTARRTLGQIGDWSFSTDRSFAEVAGLRRVPLEHVSHSKLLRDPTCFHWLDDMHVLEYIVAGDGPRDPAVEAT